ncbi:MAG: 4Fe-4S dicluster domain-containing protein [Bacillota bacterium]
MGKAKFNLKVYNERCKDCGICIEFCPQNNLKAAEDGSPVMIDQDKCTGCKLCEYMCPDFAIQVQKEEKKTTAGGN